MSLKIADRREFILKSNLSRRALSYVFLLIMLGITYRLGKPALAVLIVTFQVLAYVEIVSVASARRRLSAVSKYLLFHFFVAINIMGMRDSLLRPFIWAPLLLRSRFRSFLGFLLYSLGLIIFVTTLKRRSLRGQLYIFTVSHVTIVLLGKAAQGSVNVLRKSKFLAISPSVLVAINDTSAYVIGKLFGKTPLTRLSPKKTWEGFIGGFVTTIVLGVLLSAAVLKFGLIEGRYKRALTSPVRVAAFGVAREVPPIYFHALFFSLFASFISPFGGLFASGVKRAFNVKDFSGLIPGHGGIVDRIDCQIIMAFFTEAYINTFLNMDGPSVDKVDKAVKFIRRRLSEKQIDELVRILSKRVESVGSAGPSA